MSFPIDSVDLCANEVRVTPEGLKRLAEIAFYRSRIDVEDYLRKIQSANLSVTSTYLDAERLEDAAKDLTLATKFLSAFISLQKKERDSLVLRNQISR